MTPSAMRHMEGQIGAPQPPAPRFPVRFTTFTPFSVPTPLAPPFVDPSPAMQIRQVYGRLCTPFHGQSCKVVSRAWNDAW
eukprot:CAMPEP_0206295362 /NCGR_PEP_ID=MMETSP0106_2-20121207/5128_1 /ASSEMBLY_ACC=CAM_ASM_000206 /TAXON_ID=81532 /ORGANISM="Acanthoeca-like sp., Strain 10tr" /LENGTH=79 /DNA_ID=CAMNT_0053726015 /DNA_START=459 /DNA_END=698 /DNA_ORIENTATION=-